MVVRWKKREIEKLQQETSWGQNVSVELLKPYRNESGRVRQKYVATLGSYSIYCEPEGRSDWKVIVDDVSWIRFWTSAWKKIYDLNLPEAEIEKIVSKIETKVERKHCLFCYWHPSDFKSFSQWNKWLFTVKFTGFIPLAKKLYLSGLVKEGSNSTDNYNILKDYENDLRFKMRISNP